MNGPVEGAERVGEIVAAIVLALLSIAILVLAMRMPPGLGADLGPGALPAAIGALLLATSLGLLVRALRLPAAAAVGRLSLGHPRVWLVLVALAVVSLLFERLGYLVTMGLFLLALLRVLSGHGWSRVTTWAVLMTVGSYYLFDRLLGLTLPLGLLRGL